MIIMNHVAEYLPEKVITNDFFIEKYGLSNDEIIAKSGIKQRRRTLANETTNTMAIKAISSAIGELPYNLNEIDLIIGATYTPYDTVGTLAHAVQAYFKIEKTKCFTISSACSSFVNALEVVDTFFTAGKANKALLVVSENNSLYNDFSDPKSSFLWGDGAAAVFISKERCSDDDLEVIDVTTKGLGAVGKNIEGVYLRPSKGGLKMPFGKDVFQYACNYLIEETEQILESNGLSISELNYFIPHQANKRIIDFVVKKLKIDPGKVLNNIEYLGNTGSASTAIALAQNKHKFIKDDTIAIAVFGGGYSSGAVLLKN